MKNSNPIRFDWDENENKGTFTLILKLDIINKYTMVGYLDSYSKEHNIGTVIYPFEKKQKGVFQDLKEEITTFNDILDDFGLLNKSESQFHISHLLYIIKGFLTTQAELKNKQKVNIRLSNRIELLKELQSLTREGNCEYDIEITKKSTKDFKYNFSGETLLKKHVLRYLVGEIKSHLKTVYKELWDSNFESIENHNPNVLQIMSDHELTQNAIAKTAKTIIQYLNNETISLHNKSIIRNKLSISNKQGDFVYEVLTKMKAYTPQQRKTDPYISTNHDTIRKLIKRYSDNNEDS